MDRGAWQAIVHGVAELETTEATEQACMFVSKKTPIHRCLALLPMCAVLERDRASSFLLAPPPSSVAEHCARCMRDASSHLPSLYA